MVGAFLLLLGLVDFFPKLLWGKGLDFTNEDFPKLSLALIAMHAGNSRQTLHGGI